jgi:hypothetical protein
MHARPLGRGLSFLAILLLVSITSCSKPSPFDPLSATTAQVSGPAPALAGGFGSGTFYPLTIGNHWSYEGGGASRILSTDGSPPIEDFSYAFTETRQLIGTTHHEGIAYVVEEQAHHELPQSSNGDNVWWSRLRQDRAGLFVLDTLLQVPPTLDGGRTLQATPDQTSRPFRIDPDKFRRSGLTDAARQALADRLELMRKAVRGITRGGTATSSNLELTFLLYPLHHGLSWSTRPDFPWPIWVDGMETLETPAGKFLAYRLGVNPFGTTVHPGEWIFVWYSREGYLGYSIHAESPVTGPNGDPTGQVYVSDDSMRVTSVEIAR